jgi:DNA-nicking Smr family endonuclease
VKKKSGDNPFQALDALKAQLLAQEREAKTQAQRKAQERIQAAQSAEEARLANLDEASLFQMEMADVKPLTPSKRQPANPPDPHSFNLPVAPNEDMEVLDYLTDLVSGRADFDIAFSDEHMEGSRKGLRPKILANLRQGKVPYQDHLDLHGLNVRQAEEAIVEFIQRSVSLRRSCLLVIHGRGHRSPDGVPVLKRSLERLLLRWPIKRHILAFATAQPIDGGLGASYVLLRR